MSGSTSTVTAGSGPDQLTLKMSGDAYANGDGTSDAAGDPSFTVSVDGKPVGGTFITVASHSGGQSQNFLLNGTFGTGTHTVTVTFLNDAWGGSSSTDRNLYVNDILYDGADTGQSAGLYTGGAKSFTVTGGATTPTPTPTPSPTPPTVTAGSGPDQLTLKMSGDAYANGDGTSDAAGDPSFTVSVDGKPVGGTFITVASHSGGQSQNFLLNGTFGTGTHTVTVTFLNDAWGGSSSTDRNLYVNDILYDGADTGQSAGLYTGGAKSFTVTGGATTPTPTPTPSPTPPTVTAGSGPDQLTLKMSGDAYANGDGTSDAAGDPSFTVSVDGKPVGGTFITVASHSGGQSQNFLLNGTFGTGTHTVTVTFLNDAWGGSSSTDRNLYVNDILYDGADTGQSAGLYTGGAKSFTVTGGATTPTPTPTPSPTPTPARFQVSNDQILDPLGAVFKARGMNVASSQMGDASKILADFPGLNFIRLNVFDYESPDAYAAFISTMTAHGVVVELEDHTSSTGSDNGGSRGVAFTGTQLSNELNWYSAVARAYASNPYVWFGTDNEPPVGGISPWQQQTYNAIRDTGNNNPVMIELPGGGWPDGQTVTSYGMDPNVYAAMSNIVADVHLYGWSSHYVADQPTVNYSLANMIQSARTIPSMNGTLPVILGEYGPSTDGSTADANAAQVLQAAQQSTQTSGALAFTWNGGGADTLTDAQYNLTAYGQEVAQWIASGASPLNAASVQSATVSQADISAAAALASSMSFASNPSGAAAATSGTSGGTVYVVPAAGNGVLGFASDILDAGGTLDLTAALAATDWNGVASTLPDYLTVADSPQGATILIASTFDGPGTTIATIAGATNLNLDALLAHSIT